MHCFVACRALRIELKIDERHDDVLYNAFICNKFHPIVA